MLDYVRQFPAAAKEMQSWIDEGKLKQQATVIDGFKELPRALIRLFEGYNIGKLMVKTS